ncbi:Insect cuticle protein [Nesidiocoris tenuis]|uniref:Insect cuticle protein n=1 Tax=Nesidiocoris tenuis TaxID=355587 RepID=A0ABN7ACP2_9HEMI|nr:Insect cuticle protein [Nesidiocoris tenuis]
MTTIKLAIASLMMAAVAAEPPVYHNDISSSYGAPSHGSFGGYGGGGYESYGGHDDYSHHHEEHHEAKPYEFGYAVKDPHHGTDFGQQESSDGHNVKGSYRVLLPDGRVQIVTYHADWKTGFHADVKYEGEARYPEPQHHESGGYHYPAPSHGYSDGGSYGGYKR